VPAENYLQQLPTTPSTHYVTKCGRLKLYINPSKHEVGLKSKEHLNILSVPQRKHKIFTITRMNWLTLFKEIIAVYSENHGEWVKWRVTEC
jgi:hypothetical protein